jgi:hypothetical protein
MVSAELKQLFEQHQVAVIPTPHGTQMLIDELRSEHNAPLVVLGSPIRTTREPLDSVLHMLRERRSMMGDPAPAAALPPAVWRIRRTLHLERNPFLRDHVIGSHAVLPTAFAAAWLVNSCEQLHPGYLFSALEDLKVLKGIVFEQAAPPEYILEIKRLPSASQSDEADELRFDVLLWSEPAPGKYHYHYSGSIRLRRHLPAVPQLSPAEQQRFEQAARTTPPLLDGATLYRDGTLFHGPLLQGIQSVLQISQTTLVMRCHLPPVSLAQQGQFPIQTFNPYAVDVCVQSMPVWLRHQRAASVLPMGVRSIEQFRPLPCGVPFAVSLSLEQCSEERLIAQLAAHDLQGQLYMRLAGAEGVISSRLLRLLAGGGAD